MNVPTCCRKIPIPYVLLSGFTVTGLFLMTALVRPLPGPVLPAVQAAELQGAEAPVSEAKPQWPRPVRDPFRPLNHPVSRKPFPPLPAAMPLTPGTAKPPGHTASGGRLCGIVRVNGRSKAILRTASGSHLAEAGETIPGLGTIHEIHSKGIVCQDRQLAVGEVWP